MARATQHDGPRTGTDLPQADVGELAPKKASRRILQHEIEEGLHALEAQAEPAQAR